MASPGKCFDSVLSVLAVFPSPRDAARLHATANQLLAETCSSETTPCMSGYCEMLGVKVKAWQVGWAADVADSQRIVLLVHDLCASWPAR